MTVATVLAPGRHSDHAVGRLALLSTISHNTVSAISRAISPAQLEYQQCNVTLLIGMAGGEEVRWGEGPSETARYTYYSITTLIAGQDSRWTVDSGVDSSTVKGVFCLG